MAKKNNFIKVALIAMLKAFDAKLEELKTDAGAVLFAEIFEAGEPVFIVEGDAQIPLPVGDYVLEDGRTLSVTEEGIIGAIVEATAPEVEAGEGGTMPAADPGEKSYTVNEIKALIDAGLSSQKAEYEQKLAALEAKLTKAPEEKEPEGVKPNPEGRKTETVKLGTKKLSQVERVFELMSDN